MKPVFAISVAAAAAVVLLVSPAQAQRAAEWEYCDSRLLGTPDVRIRNCTALIESDRESPRALAMAYRNRACEYKAKGDIDRGIADEWAAAAVELKALDAPR